MSDFSSKPDKVAPKGSLIEQVQNGTHPIIQDTKADFKGIANSASQPVDPEDSEQPLSHFHSLFYDLFTWKFPKATGAAFFLSLSVLVAFRYVNVLRYVFKAAYMTFFTAAALEIAGKPLGAKGVVSSMRPKRYYTLPREALEILFEQLHELANFFVLELQRVVFVENIFATLAAFVTSFLGYFLIKYIPFWTLLLLSTITAFTAPLIYINNQELIDEQIRKASDVVNQQLSSGKKLADKYAGDAINAAKATTADLTQKVQGYTGGRKTSAPTSPSTASARDVLSSAPTPPSSNPTKFPDAPTTEPATKQTDPLLI